MPRSSDSIAALGCALAKAQAELINPEKSLTATIRTGRAGEGEEQTFRYAPLSSGLDIVRKTFGQHEIATVQTTAVDQAGGLVNLTTMLVHASGEWIASDWPVCSIADLASPRRMGAALTYARRYALFTMVGIAGEDDLDAPDLQDETPPLSPRPGPANEGGNGYASPNGLIRPAKSHAGRSGSRFGGSGKREARSEARPNVSLTPDQSAAVRDRLLAEITGISNAEQAAAWASGALSAKNHLTVADASRVEDAFERLLAATDGAVHSSADCAIDVALRTENVGRGRRDCNGSGEMLRVRRRIPGENHGFLGRSVVRHRQKCARPPRAQAPSQQRASALRRPAGLLDLRPQAVGSPSFTIHPTASPGPQGQRRIRGAALPQPSSSAASGRQRGGLVESCGHRSP